MEKEKVQLSATLVKVKVNDKCENQIICYELDDLKGCYLATFDYGIKKDIWVIPVSQFDIAIKQIKETIIKEHPEFKED